MAAACLPFLAQAACPEDAAVAAYVEAFKAAKPSPGFGKDMTPADARCARGKLIDEMPKALGKRVGYKALFTRTESRQRFGVAGPAWGAMFGGFMLFNSTLVHTKQGARLNYEPGIVVVVKDAGLADAQSPLEALFHISALVPFIELPDFMLESAPTGVELLATNGAFRGGVLGPRIPVEPSRKMLESLAKMDVVVGEDRTGREIARARGNILMGQPIRAALWLAKALKQDGIELKPGDMLSLGGLLDPVPVEPGTTISATYVGLPGNPVVVAHFE
jgi:2-oxo-hept-3-ene-1,7-dioate hydratase